MDGEAETPRKRRWKLRAESLARGFEVQPKRPCKRYRRRQAKGLVRGSDASDGKGCESIFLKSDRSESASSKAFMALRRHESGPPAAGNRNSFGSGQPPTPVTDAKLACPCRRERSMPPKPGRIPVRACDRSPVTWGLAAMLAPFCCPTQILYRASLRYALLLPDPQARGTGSAWRCFDASRAAFAMCHMRFGREVMVARR